MNGKQPIIVGIDPGTTVGLCILDIRGKIMHVSSLREMPLSSVIKRTYELGTPIAAGSDRKKAPGFIEKFCAKTGAKLFLPKEDMKGEEKADIGARTCFKNTHEFDSFCSAILAYRRIRPLLRKIKRALEREGRQWLLLPVLRLMMVDDSIPISRAISILTAVNEKPEKPSIAEKRDFKALYQNLTERYIELKIKNLELSREIERLADEQKNQNERFSRIKARLLQQGNAESIKMINQKKDHDFANLRSELSLTKTKADIKTKEFERFLANLNSCVLIKTLNDLGRTEFYKKKEMLKLRAGDIVYIRNSSIISSEIITELKNICDVVITRKPNRLLIGKFIILDYKECMLKEIDNFAIMKRSLFNSLIDRKNLLSKVLMDYKNERAS